MGKITVVLDTNVLISALGWDAKPEDCLELVLQDEVTGYISEPILDELARVMDYPRFEFSQSEKQSFHEIILTQFEIVAPRIDLEVIEDDPDDDKIVECAVAADADYIISGDKHLLELEAYDGIPRSLTAGLP